MPSYLLRVQLDDRPGSLGSLAVALGSVGADILSLDVVERSSGYAIDDLVVDLPPGAMPDMLITAAEKLTGVYVDSVRPHTGLLEAHRELELIDHVAAAETGHQLQVFVDEAPRVLRVGWCAVIEATEGALRLVAGSSGAPETQPTQAPWSRTDTTPWSSTSTSSMSPPSPWMAGRIWSINSATRCLTDVPVSFGFSDI